MLQTMHLIKHVINSFKDVAKLCKTGKYHKLDGAAPLIADPPPLKLHQ